MNGDHGVDRFIAIVGGDGHAVAELPQNARPAECGNGIAGRVLGPGGVITIIFMNQIMSERPTSGASPAELAASCTRRGREPIG